MLLWWIVCEENKKVDEIIIGMIWTTFGTAMNETNKKNKNKNKNKINDIVFLVAYIVEHIVVYVAECCTPYGNTFAHINH